MAMQIKRRIGTAGAPASLEPGQLAYNQDDEEIDSLFVGDDDSVRVLVSPLRQVEVDGDQTINGEKTISITNLRITGAGADNDILTAKDHTTGELEWTNAPSGQLTTVAVDDSLDGNGTSTDPLSVLKLATAREVDIQSAAPESDGSKTEISVDSGIEFDGSADLLITGFKIEVLDDGEY